MNIPENATFIMDLSNIQLAKIILIYAVSVMASLWAMRKTDRRGKK